VPISGCGANDRAVPAAAPAVPRTLSWGSFVPHIPRRTRGRARPGSDGRGCSGRWPRVPRSRCFCPRCFGEELHHSGFADGSGAAVVGCGLWRLCLRGYGAGRRRRAGSQDVPVRPGRTPGARGQQLPARAGMPDCDAVHKTDPGPGWPRRPPGRPKNPGNSRVPLRVLRVFGWVAVGAGWV